MSDRIQIKADTLRGAIKAAGLTQDEYADKVGISRTALQQFLRDDCRPSFDVLVAMCRELDKTAEELFPEHPWRKVENDAA